MECGTSSTSALRKERILLRPTFDVGFFDPNPQATDKLK
ncbi:hypothetical protein VCHE16_0504 [Vibrio paracholerae HE-16]|nr:hypothetical protein VCHE16_0504 [Vibrio paracholerae HE-16]